MKLRRLWLSLVFLATVAAFAQPPAKGGDAAAASTPADSAATSASASAVEPATAVQAPSHTAPPVVDPSTAAVAGAVSAGKAPVPRADLLEHLVDVTLNALDVPASGNTAYHYGIAAIILAVSILMRRIVVTWLFALLRKFAKRTTTTIDDELFPAVEGPVKAFVALIGAVAAIKVLKLSPQADNAFAYASTVAYSLVLFWFFLRVINTVLDHLQRAATTRQMGVAAFMPWIKKALIVLFIVFGALLVAQNLGADVKAFLAGLGIGGLAFALAAQDTLANLFGSVVVAIDQPFRTGEVVQIGDHAGKVEDIGLRSTKLRTAARTLIAIPNRTVAGEPIINLSRMPQRRIEQTIGLTYDTTPEQMEAIVADIRALLRAEPRVAQDFLVVNFTNYGACSLDIQIIYFAADPDYVLHLQLREDINLRIMRAVLARGLGFAFPTQTLNFDGSFAQQLAASRASGATPGPQT